VMSGLKRITAVILIVSIVENAQKNQVEIKN
jgi:hypothetical protein